MLLLIIADERVIRFGIRAGLTSSSTRSSDEVGSADQWPADDAMLQSVPDPLSPQGMQKLPRSIVAVVSGSASRGSSSRNRRRCQT